MLISFTVANYRSIREPVTLDLRPAKRIKGLEQENLLALPNGDKLLNAVAIYGANASGKSNLIKAMEFMRRFMRSSVLGVKGDKIEVTPFLLSDVTGDGPLMDFETYWLDGPPPAPVYPSRFEVKLLIDKTEYEYGFEVTPDEVLKEWLYGRACKPRAKRSVYFEKSELGTIKVGTLFRDWTKNVLMDAILNTIRPNSLFLTVAAQFNADLANEILGHWTDEFERSPKARNIFLDEEEDIKAKVSDFVSSVDLGISSLRVRPVDGKSDASQKLSKRMQLPLDFPSLASLHKTASGREVLFDFWQTESDGTKQSLTLACRVFRTLAKGGVLIIDEIEQSLHPLLVMELVRLFQSERNTKGAQLVFTTHDTGLLNSGLLRRDQIWFTEKRPDQSTDLYSLSEIDAPPRKGESLERNYLRGKYGAVPYLGDWQDGRRKQ